jgi:uncharacterized sulfatase
VWTGARAKLHPYSIAQVHMRNAPSKYFDPYPLSRITLPDIAPGYRSKIPAPALSYFGSWPYNGVTPQQAIECKRAYYAAISFVDAQIGRVLDAVDRLGLRDNAVIVFWSDHGYHLGEHGLWFKLSLFEESARVPMVICAPGMAAGKVSPRNVELVDLYPTLADLAGLTPPDGLEGVSLRPFLVQPEAEWKRPAFTQVERAGFAGHSVRADRWRYTEWAFGSKGAELYDHASDPQEVHNLIHEEKLAPVVADLKALLKEKHPARVEGGVALPGNAPKASHE